MWFLEKLLPLPYSAEKAFQQCPFVKSSQDTETLWGPVYQMLGIPGLGGLRHCVLACIEPPSRWQTAAPFYKTSKK